MGYRMDNRSVVSGVRNPCPGSQTARFKGCICPVEDNAYGNGYRGRAGTFMVSHDCKLHWPALSLVPAPDEGA